jgi:AraC family transcriptional regulator
MILKDKSVNADVRATQNVGCQIRKQSHVRSSEILRAGPLLAGELTETIVPVVDKIIWQIESRLDENLSLQILSDCCAVSAHHMCRVFLLVTGMSVMSYVRARKLSEAAKAVAGQDADILAVALDAGYGSHEAFTRAFAKYFGVLPSTVRQARTISILSLLEPFEMKKEMIVEVAKPEIRDREAFRVVGLSVECSFENTGAIPALWRAFNAREADVVGAKPGAAYGVCCDAGETERFRYLAGVEATEKTQGMDFVDIPANRYAVFTHSGHVSDLPKTVYTIWNKSLPEEGFEPVKALVD